MRQTLLLNSSANFAPRIDEQGIQAGKSTLVNLRIARLVERHVSVDGRQFEAV
jgi:hypothetical protein